MITEILSNVKTTAAILAAVCLSYFAGFFIGKHDRPPVKPEPPAAEVKHKDGSITLARMNTPPPPPLPEPPRTAARIRTATIKLAPLPEASEIQMDLVKLEDGTERVTVKGPAIIGGEDFPIGPIASQSVKKWTVGIGAGFKSYTAIGLRRVGPVEIGGIVQRDRLDRRAWDAGVMLIWRF